MSYNNENYYKLREEYAEKPLRAIEKADARKAELRQKVEGYAELDNILAATASRIMGAAMQGREGLDARIAKIKRETAETRDAMQILLKDAGTTNAPPAATPALSVRKCAPVSGGRSPCAATSQRVSRG